MTRKPSDTDLQPDDFQKRNLQENASYRYSDDEQGTDWAYLVAGSLFVAAGGYLIYRGITAYGETDDGFYDNRSRINGVQVRESVTVNKPVSELYGYWRNLENLGNIMTHLESVRELGGERSRWVANGPLGTSIEWDAVITDDRQDELIAWRSVENADVPNEGAVRFSKTGRNGASTQVLVSLTYHPPGGQLGAVIAKLFGEEPAQQISDDLTRFKREMESGTLRGAARAQSQGTQSQGVQSQGTAPQSQMLGHEEGTPSLGVPGSSSDLRSDNVAKDPLHTQGDAIPTPESDISASRDKNDKGAGELAKTPEGALPPQTSGNTSEKN